MTHQPSDENAGRVRAGEPVTSSDGLAYPSHDPADGRHSLLECALGPARVLWAGIDPDAAPGRRTLDRANELLEAEPIRNALGRPLRADASAADTCHYEVAILFRAALAFRLSGYHDWFNLLSWRVWPRAKAALNLRHTLHYLAQLERLYPGQSGTQLGRKLPRDAWMQCIAMLDEGGCVASEGLVAQYAELDDRGVYRWTKRPGPEALDEGLRWFGHAVLETLKLGRPGPRMWVSIFPALSDDALARRVLTFAPELEPRIRPLLERLPGLEPWFQEAVDFGEGDPFVKPGRSIIAPWTPAGESPAGETPSVERPA